MMLIKVALRSLLRSKRRSFVTGLTVAVGAGALFIFDGFNSGIMNQYRDNSIHARYGYGQINTAGYRDKVYPKPWEHWMTDAKALQSEVEGLPEVEVLFPRVEFSALLTNGDITVAGRGVGIDAKGEAGFFHTLNVEKGKTLTTENEGMMLGRGLARALDVKPGDSLTVLSNTVYGSLNGVQLEVIGIFHVGTREVDDVIFKIPLEQAQILLESQKIESFAVGLRDLSDWPAFEKYMNEKHSELEVTPFNVLDKVYYQHGVDWLDAQFGVIQLIIIAVVILGIFNTASSAILERTREIGNLRANGESVGEILTLLAWEGFGIGVIGAFVGVVGAYAICHTILGGGLLMPPAPGLTRQYVVFVELQSQMAIIAFFLGTVTALIGTVLAGIKVARTPIGKALRTI